MMKSLTVFAFALLLFTFIAPITIIAHQTIQIQTPRITTPTYINIDNPINSSQSQGPGSGGGGGGGI